MKIIPIPSKFMYNSYSLESKISYICSRALYFSLPWNWNNLSNSSAIDQVNYYSTLIEVCSIF